MIMVDTSVWVDYFNGKVTPQTDALEGLLGSEIVVTGDLIYAEVLQGFTSDKEFRTARGLLDALVFHEMLGRRIAYRSAANFRALRKKGLRFARPLM